MTQITTCPQCHTRFRVTAEQLAARKGDVRCGRCSHIFNAYGTLAAEAQEQEIAHEHTNHETYRKVDSIRRSGFSPTCRAEARPPVFQDSQGVARVAESAAAEEAEPLPEEPLIDFQVDTFAAIESSDEAVAPLPLPQAEPRTEAEAEPQPESAAKVRVVRVPSPPLAIETRVSPDSPKYGPPPKPRHAWPWVLASLVLLFGLVGQGVYFFRNAIAANYPPVRPLLERACVLLQCNISLPQNPDLLSIESSELHADPARANIVVLTSTLRNRASYVQAYPVLELTLTNARDEMVARRLFLPKEYVRQASDIARGIPAKGDVAVKLLMDLGDLKAEGYRLYLFFPGDVS